MCTRFESRLNKPSLLDITSKTKVLKEYSEILELMDNSQIHNITPTPTKQTSTLAVNSLSQTKSSDLELLLFPHVKLKAKGNAVISDFYDDTVTDNSIFKTPKQANSQSRTIDIYKEPYKTKHKVDKNLWDIQNFSSLDNKLPIYPRRTGYVDFDSMPLRPPMALPDVHESRFLLRNPFPSPLSSVKHKPEVFFIKNLPRDERVLYNGVNMSETLYDPDLRNLIRPTLKGTLQFAQSTLGKDGKKLLESPRGKKSESLVPYFATPAPKKNESPRTKDVLQGCMKQVKVIVDNSLPNTIKLGKKLPRITSPNPNAPNRQNKETLKLMETLPGYMHNQGTRKGAEHTHSLTLRDISIGNTEYLAVDSTLNKQKIVFRIDPKTQRKIDSPLKKKQQPTFNELLTKEYSDIVDKSKQTRPERAWHIKPGKTIDQVEQEQSDAEYAG